MPDSSDATRGEATNLETISRLSFPKAATFFNAASIGEESDEAKKDAMDDAIRWESALEEMKEQYSKLLGTSAQHVTVFHNTTAGVQRIFLRLTHLLRGHRATLLTTDLEYPGIIALVDETWHGRVIIAQVAELINKGRGQEVSEQLKQLFLLTQADVIYISHIARAFGFHLEKSFLEFVRQVNPQTVLIVDGAQAVGNIVVRSPFLNLVDFYVASGHKWLCGKQTLGLIWCPPEWKLADPAQSYSRRTGSGGTGVVAALRSLAKALQDFNDFPGTEQDGQRMMEIEEHNARLGSLFLNGLREHGIPVGLMRPQNAAGANGIVSIPSLGTAVAEDLKPDKVQSDHEHDKKQLPIDFTPIREEPLVPEEGGEAPGPRFLLRLAGPELQVERRRLREARTVTPLPAGGVYRFCFHYYHSKLHVDNLIERIDASFRSYWTQVNKKAPVVQTEAQY